MSNGYIGVYPKFSTFAPELIAAGITTHTLTYAPGSANAIQVIVGGVIQQPNVAYTVSGQVVTFAAALPHDGWIQYRGLEVGNADSSLINGDPVLSERWISSRNQLPSWTGYVPQDGGLYSREEFPTAWAAIQAGLVPVVSEATWIADPTKRASFTAGDGTSTFRVPDKNGKYNGSTASVFLRGDGAKSGSAGELQGDAIRNITGNFSNVFNEGYIVTSGVLSSRESVVRAKGAEGSGSQITTMGLDASLQVPTTDTTAGENRPYNVAGVYILKLYGAVMNPGVLDQSQTKSNFIENDQIITTSYAVPSGKNAMIAGPISVADGVVITVSDGSTLTVV